MYMDIKKPVPWWPFLLYLLTKTPVMKRLYLLLIAGLLMGRASASAAEIAVGTSIDWLCYDADVILIGRLTETVENKKADPYSDYLNTSRMNVSVIIKGEMTTDKLQFSTRLPYIGGHQLKNLVGKDIVVFLKTNAGHYHAWDAGYSVVCLDDPQQHALSGEFTCLKNRQEITGYIEETLKKLEGKTAEPYYLEIPKDTEVHGVLYGGSSCYLIVPNVLYPKARKNFFD